MKLYLKTVLQQNSWYFIGFGLLLLTGLAVLWSIEQGDESMWCSQHRTTWADVLFKYGTRLGEGLTFGVLALLFLWVRFGTALFIGTTGIIVMLLSAASKKIFAHPRPLSYFNQMDMADQLSFVEGVRIYGGATSFPSGHTMAAFALYTFLALVLPRKQGVALVLLGIAVLVGLSRIYLIQHFLKDVLFGAVLGVGVALLCHYWHQRSLRRAWANRSLRPQHRVV